MAITKMFRDRVVSMEQTLEIGEKHLDLLTELIREAFPEAGVVSHELEAESDLFLVVVEEPGRRPRRVRFTRMVLSDATCIPSAATPEGVLAKNRILEALRSQAAMDNVLVTFRQVMDTDDRLVAEEMDAEWRRKEAAAQAARRVEEERRLAERRRLKELEQARQKLRREKQRGPEPKGGPSSAGAGRGPVPAQPQAGAGAGKRRRRRGRAGPAAGQGQERIGPSPAQGGAILPAPGQGQPQPPRPPRPPRPARPPMQAQAPPPGPRPLPLPSQTGGTGLPDGGPVRGPEGAGGKRRRRHRRRGGGGGGTVPPAGNSGSPGQF
jgi:hypothetical protein